MNDYDRADYGRTAQRSLTGWLVLVGFFFVAGMLTMGWVLTRWDTAAPYLSWMRPAPAEPAARPAGLMTSQPAMSADVERRVDDLENRIDRIADRAAAASGNADRAEALLVAFAARRAIDRGLQLGYIEGLLRERFGGLQPQAVATVISAAHEPVTLDELRADLEELAPQLSGVGTHAGWWESVRRELASAIVVRRSELPPATPDDRIARARHAIDADHVDRALAEVARLPARDKATAWIAKARRYIAAHNALDLIETSALLMPANREHRLAAPVKPAPARPDAG